MKPKKVKRVTVNPKALTERKESAAELAEALGVKRGAATNLRRGGCDRLHLKTFIALCEHLGVSIEAFESFLIIEREED